MQNQLIRLFNLPLTLERPMVLAHRGLVTECQENTLSAVLAAQKNPACDGCEFDVCMTKDQELVLFHDQSLKRLFGINLNIEQITWAQLQQLTIEKSIMIDGQVRHYPHTETVPKLIDVLRTITDPSFVVDIDIKTFGLSFSQKRSMAKRITKIIQQTHTQTQVICSSFDIYLLHQIKDNDKNIVAGFAYDDEIPLKLKWINWAMERNLVGRFLDADVSVVEHTLIDNNTIKKHHKKSMPVGTYTLFPLRHTEEGLEKKQRHVQEVMRLTKQHIDWIETDNPEQVFSLISELNSDY